MKTPAVYGEECPLDTVKRWKKEFKCDRVTLQVDLKCRLTVLKLAAIAKLSCCLEVNGRLLILQPGKIMSLKLITQYNAYAKRLREVSQALNILTHIVKYGKCIKYFRPTSISQRQEKVFMMIMSLLKWREYCSVKDLFLSCEFLAREVNRPRKKSKWIKFQTSKSTCIKFGEYYRSHDQEAV